MMLQSNGKKFFFQRIVHICQKIILQIYTKFPPKSASEMYTKSCCPATILNQFMNNCNRMVNISHNAIFSNILPLLKCFRYIIFVVYIDFMCIVIEITVLCVR